MYRSELSIVRGTFAVDARCSNVSTASKVIRQSCPRLIPEVLVHVGYLKGVIYSSDKGDFGRPKTYIHFMERPPRLTSNTKGDQLYIVGGNYRITECGIEG